MKPFSVIIFSLLGFVAVFFADVLLKKETVTSYTPIDQPFINGVSFVAPSQPVTSSSFDSLLNVHAGWIAVMPFAFSPGNVPDIVKGTKHQWWGEQRIGLIRTIQLAHSKGFKVMMKPHLWVRGQGWAGDFRLNSESDWQRWEQSYLDYIVPLARLSDSLHVELFCVGLELKNVVKLRPDCWDIFINAVRDVYRGALTYAANWDNYENFPNWDQLDYIGINAYFPLSSAKNPSGAEIMEGWKIYHQKIKNIYEKYKKPVIFTEYGYRSANGAVMKPWENPDLNNTDHTPNYELQQNAYEALFETFWTEPWFRGGFLWKWYDNQHLPLLQENIDYTPQQKPAEKVVRHWYSLR